MKTYFTIEEICASTVAKKNNINNAPVDAKILNNINILIENLNALREVYGAPIRVSSGYRSPELNKKVGGVKTSQHCTGQAADLLPLKMEDFDYFTKFCRTYYKYNNFDLLILEYSGNSKWIHISFSDKNRRLFLLYKNGKYSIWNE